MSFKQIIKSTLSPSIQLVELSTPDDSTGSDKKDIPYEQSKLNRNTKQAMGADAPFIKIGRLEIEKSSIESVILDETGIIPTVLVIFEDTTGVFGGDAFPKTNLVMQVYIKTANPKFKPIRCDFLISNIKSSSPSEVNISTSKGVTYILTGELYAPKLYYNIAKSYSKVSSKSALLQIAKDMGLGFAENESAPSDVMTWINYNTDNLNFIKEIISHAYQDDNTFFISFIDKYYHLNYININQQLLKGELQNTLSNAPKPKDMEANQLTGTTENKKDKFDIIPLFLSSDPQSSKSSNYILEYSLISNQGVILKNSGYKKKIYYYNHLANEDEAKNKFINFYVSPIFTSKESDKPLIPSDEILKDVVISKWVNIDYGNTHKNWNAAKLINFHNLNELEKIKLNAKVNGINFQIIRGAIIPVEIKIPQQDTLLKKYLRDENSKEKIAPDLAKDSTAMILDTQLSGPYYVQGIKYIYDKDTKFSTEYILARREWPVAYK